MECIELIVGHSVQNFLDGFNLNEISRCVDDESSIGEGWFIANASLLDNLRKKKLEFNEKPSFCHQT